MVLRKSSLKNALILREEDHRLSIECELLIQLHQSQSINKNKSLLKGGKFPKVFKWYHNLFGKLICCKSLNVKPFLAQRKKSR